MKHPKYTFPIRQDQLDLLNKLKADTGCPVAELIRRAIDKVYKQTKGDN